MDKMYNSQRSVPVEELQKAAAFFCAQYADSTVQNGSINIADTIIAGDRSEGRETIVIAYVYLPSMGNQDDVYDIAVTSVLQMEGIILPRLWQITSALIL